jgi:hypothetical protein
MLVERLADEGLDDGLAAHVQLRSGLVEPSVPTLMRQFSWS